MNVSVLASLFAGLVIGFVLGCWWQRRKTRASERKAFSDYVRLHVLTNRTAAILEKVDPEVVAEAEGKVLVQEGTDLLEGLEE